MTDPLSHPTSMTDPLSHPMYRSPEANRFFWNTLIRKRILEYYRTEAPPEREEPENDG